MVLWRLNASDILVNIGSDIGLSPMQHHTITRASGDIVLIVPIAYNPRWHLDTNTVLGQNPFENVMCQMATHLV